MSLYSEPPDFRDFKYDKPTLLVCWWATALCTCIICLRIIGRFIRTERLFPEDRIAALALIPLFLRMGCVHYILLYGTNNVQLEGLTLTDADMMHRRVASGLVLISRILYAATYVILRRFSPFQKRVPDKISRDLICRVRLCTWVWRMQMENGNYRANIDFN